MSVKKILIDQRENFATQFGCVFRSSAVFYFRSDEKLKTTISILNYWKLKRGIDVQLLASVREMDGSLVFREELNFIDGDVINYSPIFNYDFEGSVEIEVFSSKNMLIPYAAVIGYYETSRGLSMVHSYARSYSRHEVEEGRTISNGEEACWTLRDTGDNHSFGVFHNGPHQTPPKKITLSVQSNAFPGEVREAVINLRSLNPFETIRIIPSEVIPDLQYFLKGQLGFASLTFQLSESFTRMLIGHQTNDDGDLQVTHSNFNYRKHQTNHLNDSTSCYMYVPSAYGKRKSVIVYPDSDPGDYQLRWGGEIKSFSSSQALAFGCDSGLIEFTKVNGLLPSRIVTGLSFAGVNGLLPAEMSLGAINVEQPPKRLWWGPLQWSGDRQCRIVIHHLEQVYGQPTSDQFISIALYRAKGPAAKVCKFPMTEIHRLEEGLLLNEFWPDVSDMLDGEPGYYTIYSDYPGLTVYSIIERDSGSLAVEHGF